MTDTPSPAVSSPPPSLPSTPDAFAQGSWDDILPHYDALAATPPDQDTAEEWLARWTTLEELVGEAATLASIAYTCDTGNKEKEEAHLRFAAEIAPKQHEQQVRLARLLLKSGFSRPDLTTTLRRFQTDEEIFRVENMGVFTQLEELETAYNRMSGAMSTEWEGKRLPVPQLAPFLKSGDRAVRERAFRGIAEPYIEQRDALAANFNECYLLRQKVAANAGFANFQDYCFASKYRFDYTPDDCRRFHDGVEEAVAPLVERLHARRRDALNVATLRPWDLSVNVGRSTPLKPFESGAEFVATARRMFDSLDTELGSQFNEMADEGLLDLENRPGKAPGGYCTTLQWRGKPFVFMNAVGVPDDVNTLIHEAGHCFHDFAMDRLPFIFQRSITMEAAELASMSMELLAKPFLAKPVGYYSEQDVAYAWLEHLEDIATSLCHIASVDAFQSWIYTSGEGGDADARDAAWLRIRERFERGVDWSGLTPQRVARWYRQSHIFLVPFYYIEYGIAQFGALQVWRNSMRGHRDAVAAYKQALALGGTASLADMYATAGASLVFDTATMKELMLLLEEQIEEVRHLTRG